MMFRIAMRMLREVDLRLLWKFCYTFGFKGFIAVEAFKRRIKKGKHFPAFMFLSLTNNCNLRCQGCWVTPTKPIQELDLKALDGIIRECKTMKSRFFGLLGGEPFLHSSMFDLIERHPDCYFQIFTNGLLITEEVAARMKQLGNVTPLISIEGFEEVSDVRRGGTNVYARSMEGIAHCRRAGLVTGVATSVCKSNFDDLVSERFVEQCIGLGVQYLWYYIYRPVGPRPTPELVLDEEQVLRLRQFMVDIRCKTPIVIVDAYWNHKGEALCPASTGISHHINAAGDLEPCPVVQFSDTSLANGRDIVKKTMNSEFITDFRGLTRKLTRGCILMDYPEELKQHVEENKVGDSSGRGAALDELAAMKHVPGHHIPCKEIPEKSWMYRFAKKNWFFGFGAYG